MPKLFIDLTDDEQHWNGKISVLVAAHDTLTGVNHGLMIGDEIEVVLSTPQAITLFDVLDGWLNGCPVKAIGDIERRIMAAIKTTIEDQSESVRSMKSRPEEFAHVLYDNMKIKGLRFRLCDGGEA